MRNLKLTADSDSTVIPSYIADTAATMAFLAGSATPRASRLAAIASPRLVRQPETGERHACQADTEFFQRLPPRGRLGQAFCQFIEFIVHNIPLPC